MAEDRIYNDRYDGNHEQIGRKLHALSRDPRHDGRRGPAKEGLEQEQGIGTVVELIESNEAQVKAKQA